MKKFLVFFTILFGITCGAMAGDYYGNYHDSKGGDGNCILKPGTTQDGPYAVYFVTGKYEAPSECVDYFKNVKSELQQLWNGKNIAYFVIVGSADTQGDKNRYDNVQLSKDRYDYVVNNIMPSGAITEDRGWVAGSAAAKEFAPEYTGDWRYRGVYIYPIWARSECEKDTMDNVQKTKDALNEALPKHEDKKDEINKALNIISQIEQICSKSGTKLGKTEAEEYANLLSQLPIIIMELVQDIPELSDVSWQIDLYQNSQYMVSIDTYYSSLSKLQDGLKISEWRNSEGKFNTARLASDSIAGVVLGTVGGIVTSKVVKKNQLKKGFEDLSCNVGGQKIADYGDMFSVGLQ